MPKKEKTYKKKERKKVDYMYEEREKKEVFVCHDCHEEIDRDLSTYVDCIDACVCDNCLNDNYFYCDNCQEYHSNDEDTSYEVWNTGDIICQNCHDNDYFECENCHNVFHESDSYSIGWDNYCHDCYYEIQEETNVDDYHDYEDDWHLHKLPTQNEDDIKYRIGWEAEIEPKGSIKTGEVKYLKNLYLDAYATSDSSLAYGGIEIVNNPETFEYSLDTKEEKRKFFNGIEELDYGHANNSGLHFHVTRPNDEIISRILVILESFKVEIKKLSRRNSYQLDEWAKFLTDGCSEETKCKLQSKKYLKDKYLKEGHGRYFALNLQNSNTIEFRFFNGVNNFQEFWAALQFIHNLVEIAFDEERELDTIKWKDLIVGEELVAEAKRLGVYEIDKTAKDTTEMYEKLEDLQNLARVRIVKTMQNMIKYINKQIANKSLGDLKSNDIAEIERNTNNALRNIRDDLDYLNSVIYVYNNINENTSIRRIKDDIEYNIKYNKKSEEYRRYFNEFNKIFKNYESEVAA